MKISAKQYRRFYPLIVLLVLLGSIGLIFWFGILPLQRFAVEKADGIQEYYATKENRERQIGALPDLQKQYENIVDHEQSLRILLSEDQIVDFVKTLERLAEETETSVSIEAKSKDAIEEKADAKNIKKTNDTSDDTTSKKKAQATILDSVPYSRYLHVNVIVQGEYSNILSFLHKMETLPLGLDVVGLSIRKKDTEAVAPQSASPRNNPFLILAQGDVPAETVAPVAKSVGSLEATFDTVVYVSK